MNYLLQISIGPVQGFIAASRKTRDLKSGSNLLVDITTAVAKSVEAGGGKLIFPAATDLKAANLVTAIVSSEPAKVVEAARATVNDLLQAKWKEAKRALGASVNPGTVEESLAQAQLKSFAEISGAWSEVADTPDGYKEARKRVGMLAASRKSLRDFGPSPSLGDADRGAPKSPLDPAYDTVLPFAANRNPRVVLRPNQVSLKQREALDAVSVIRRFTRSEFPSTRHVANAELLQVIRLDALEAIAKDLETDALELWLNEGFEDGLSLEDEILQGIRSGRRAARNQLDQINQGRRRNNEQPLRIRPYYAILIADGDHMGAHLNEVVTPEAHREFSRTLAQSFANEVDPIVQSNRGNLVYAGGDDVLALLPMHTALKCAKEINELFARVMPAGGPTLSAGIAVVHVSDDLQDSFAFAREMEKLAKNDGRDRLAVGVNSRGGSPVAFSVHWDEIDRFSTVMNLYVTSNIPRGIAYEARQLAMELGVQSQAVRNTLTPLELKRIAARKQPNVPDNTFAWVQTHEQLLNYANMLAVGHFLTRGGDE